MPADALALPDPDRALAPLAEHDALLLAVSGGPDSVALMLLAAEWSHRAAKRIEIATVDHGLRAEAAQEALRVGEWCSDLGFPHHILRWEGEKPTTRIQERARAARYGLLCACARESGASAVVTAHHADDQAETILFRLTRGSAIAGLAGMAASRLDGLALLRPLLGLRKQALEAFCAARGRAFLRDPSNENPAYARVRLRRLGGLLEEQGLGVDALLRLGARAARAEEALAAAAAEAATALPAVRDERVFEVAAAPLQSLPREILQRVVAAEIERIGASAPRLERQERMCERLAEALALGSSFKATLGGAAITLARGRLTIRPEPPRQSRAAAR
jgi:tRNA(Ile)-lysidine synthase